MNYLKSLALIVIVSALGGMLRHTIAQTNLVMLYILIVVLAAVRWGRGPSLFSAVISVLIFDFFFVPPHLSMTVDDTQYLLAFATLFIVAIVISSLTLKAREKAMEAEKRERQTQALYALSRDLVKSIDKDAVYNILSGHVDAIFGAGSVLLIFENGLPVLKGPEAGFRNREEDLNAALSSFSGETPAGKSTRIYPMAEGYYLPLKTAGKAFGALGILYRDNSMPDSGERLRLMETFSNQISFAIERLKLTHEAQQAELLRRAARLHTAFLNSVSHDLKTPIATITGALSSLIQSPGIDDENRKVLIETAYGECGLLNQLVGDLLDMARVEGGVKVNRKPEDVRDLIGASLKHTAKTIKGFRIDLNLPEGLPEIPLDFTLMMKVFVNIIDNAVKYSPGRRELDISAFAAGGNMEFTLADRGIGVPGGDLLHIFDKFYRVKRPEGFAGTGLGLSICKGIVEAHNGSISAKNRDGGGLVISIILPEKA